MIVVLIIVNAILGSIVSQKAPEDRVTQYLIWFWFWTIWLLIVISW